MAAAASATPQFLGRVGHGVGRGHDMALDLDMALESVMVLTLVMVLAMLSWVMPWRRSPLTHTCRLDNFHKKGGHMAECLI